MTSMADPEMLEMRREVFAMLISAAEQLGHALGKQVHVTGGSAA